MLVYRGNNPPAALQQPGYASIHLNSDSLLGSVAVGQLAVAGITPALLPPLPTAPRRRPYPMPAAAFGLDAVAHASALDRCLDRRAVLLAEPGTTQPACGCVIPGFEGCIGAGCGGPRDPTVPAAAILEPGCADWLCQCQGISNRFVSDSDHNNVTRDRHDRLQRPLSAALQHRVRAWWGAHGCKTTAAHADPQAIHIFDPERCPDCQCYPRHQRGDVATGLVLREALHRFLPPVRSHKLTGERGESRYFGVAPGDDDGHVLQNGGFYRAVRDIAHRRGYVSWPPRRPRGGAAKTTTRGPQLVAIGCRDHATRPIWVTTADTVVWKIDLATARDRGKWGPCRATAWALLKSRYASIQVLTSSRMLGPRFAPNTRLVSDDAMPPLLDVMARTGATVLLYATKSLDNAIPWRSGHLSSYEYNDVNGLPLRFAPLGSFFNSSVPFWRKNTVPLRAGTTAGKSTGNSISGSPGGSIGGGGGGGGGGGTVEDASFDASLALRAAVSGAIAAHRVTLSRLRLSHGPRDQRVLGATGRLARLLVETGSDAEIAEAGELCRGVYMIQTILLGRNHTKTLMTAVGWAAAIVANKNVKSGAKKAAQTSMKRAIDTLRERLGRRDPKVRYFEELFRIAVATVKAQTAAQTARRPAPPPPKPDVKTPMSLLVISLKAVSREQFYATMPRTAALFAAQNSGSGGDGVSGDHSGALRRSLYPPDHDLVADTQGVSSGDGGAPRMRPRLFPSNDLLDRLAATGYTTLSTADSCNMDLKGMLSTAQHGHELLSHFCRIRGRAEGIIPAQDRTATATVFVHRFYHRQKFATRSVATFGHPGAGTQKITRSRKPWATFLHLSAGDEDSMVATAAMDSHISLMLQDLERTWSGMFSAVIVSDGGLDRGECVGPR